MTEYAERVARLATSKRSRPWALFCGYCGARPPSSHGLTATRVCRQCNLGLMLEAPEDATPAKGDTFFVVDQDLILRALSLTAERLLDVSEPEVVGEPLERLLPMSAQRGRLQRTLKLAATGDETRRHASVLLGRGRGSCRASMTCCGPVPGALIVLEL